MLQVDCNNLDVWRATDTEMPGFEPKPSSYYKRESDKKLRTLHKNLSNEWELNSPDVRRILLPENQNQSSNRRELYVSADVLTEGVQLQELEKGTSNMQNMARHEQIHRLQGALQNRIMAHKYGDSKSMVHATQIKAIGRLMEYLSQQLASLCEISSLTTSKTRSLANKSFESYKADVNTPMLVSYMDNFYQARKMSRTIDDKISSQNKLGDTPTKGLQKDRRANLVEKMLVKDVVDVDFHALIQENENDVYFLLGLPSRPSVRQLLGNFRNHQHRSLQHEQQMYHLFNLCVLSNTLLEKAYNPKCLL